jgi:AcrR family transcriptional regulator
VTTAPTRRERQRQATYAEIVDVSRRLLRASEDVSIRAVASEMGLTAPALYRYVDSHSELMLLVARSIFADVVAAMTVARDEHPADDPAAQIVASAAAFRKWALSNREEFQLVFASAMSSALEEAAQQVRAAGLHEAGRTDQSAPPATGGEQPSVLAALEDCMPEETGVHLFGAFFSEIFGRLWARYRFHVPEDAELDPRLLEALRPDAKPDAVTDGFPGPTPGMVWMFERAWARLYGTVTLEVFGHVHPAFISTGALFDATMLEMGRELGIAEEWPRLQVIARAQY